MTDREIATLYAVQKLIEAKLKDHPIPAGSSFDLSGETVTITLPTQTTVYREKGQNGFIFKKATQNLYGYAVWVFLLRRLAKFNQAAHMRKLIMEAWTEAMRCETKVEDELEEIDPEVAAHLESLKKLDGPKRKEATPRKVDFADPNNAKFVIGPQGPHHASQPRNLQPNSGTLGVSGRVVYGGNRT